MTTFAQMTVAGGAMITVTTLLRLTLRDRLPRAAYLFFWGAGDGAPADPSDLGFPHRSVWPDFSPQPPHPIRFPRFRFRYPPKPTGIARSFSSG